MKLNYEIKLKLFYYYFSAQSFLNNIFSLEIFYLSIILLIHLAAYLIKNQECDFSM